MQCAALRTRLCLLEFIDEVFKWQVPPRSQKHPNALHEGVHYCFVILSPQLRMHEHFVDCAWELLKQSRYLAGHLTKTR